MDMESDIEEEDLQRDIREMNEVLGDEDDEGDDSEFDLETDDHEQVVDDELTPRDNELQLHDPSVRHEPLEELTGLTGASNDGDDCTVLQLLRINQDSQRNLQHLLVRVREELARNQTEQDKVSANPNDQEPKNVDLSVRGIFRNYLEDGFENAPPNNIEAKQRKAANMPNPFELPRMKWKSQQDEKLEEGVKTDGRKRKMQPLLNRREVLEAKMDRLSVPEELEMVYDEIEQIDKKLAKAEYLPTSELLGDRFRDIDWEFVANVDLEGERTAEECQLHWQNLLHPSISRKTWTKKEKEDLMKIAAEYEYRDWASIAKELGTGRTALQCLRMFQNMDPTFIKSKFTKEEDELLGQLVQRLQVGTKFIPFHKVSYFMEGRTQSQVSYRWMKQIDPSIKRGKWSQEEIEKLNRLIADHGARNWAHLAQVFPGRTQFQIRHRWKNMSSPLVKHGIWGYPETMAFLRMTQKHGVGNWAKIARALKEPGVKGRTAFHLLSRFKQVTKTYFAWKASTGQEAIDEEEFYKGNWLPDVMTFLDLQEEIKRKRGLRTVRLAALTSKPSLSEQRKVRRRRRKAHRQKRITQGIDKDDAEDSESSLSPPCNPPRLTARQKALALKKGHETENPLPVPNVNGSGDVGSDPSSTGQTRRELGKESQESRLKAENHSAGRKLPLAAAPTSSSNEDENSSSDEENKAKELDPFDARNSEDEDDEESFTDRQRKEQPPAPRGRSVARGLAGWLTKLKVASAEVAAQAALKSQQMKMEQEAALQRLEHEKQKNSTFDVQSSLELVHLKRSKPVGGRKQYTELDNQLVKAVDPMWLCRNGSSGRHTKHSLKAQNRTRQEKLCKVEQKAMFGLLLQVFDVDVHYTTTLAKRSLMKSKSTDSSSHIQRLDQEGHQGDSDGSDVAATPHWSTGVQRGVDTDNQTAGSSHHVVTSGPEIVPDGLQKEKSAGEAVTGASQVVESGLQGMGIAAERESSGPQSSGPHFEGTSSHQAATDGQQGRTNAPPAEASDLQRGACAPQAVARSTQGVARHEHTTDGPQVVTTGPQCLQTVPNDIGMNCPQSLTEGPQGVTASPKTLTTGPLGVVASPQALISGPQGVATSPQTFMTGPQGVATGPHALITGPQVLITGPQGMPTSPQVLITGPQRVATGPQVPITEPQGVATNPQVLITGQQEVATVPHPLIIGPQRVIVLPQGGPGVQQALTVGQEGVTNAPNGTNIIPQTLTLSPQGVISIPQQDSVDSQGITSSQQGHSSSLQGKTSDIPQGETTQTQSENAGIQEVASASEEETGSSQAENAGPQGEASGTQKELVIEQVNHQEPPDTIPTPALPTVKEMTEAVMGSGLLQQPTELDPQTQLKNYQQRDPLVGSLFSVKQQLDLLRKNETRSSVSKNIKISLKSPVHNPEAALGSLPQILASPLGLAMNTCSAQNPSNPGLHQQGNAGTLASIGTPVGIPQQPQNVSFAPQSPYLFLQNIQMRQPVVAQRPPQQAVASGQAQVNMLQNTTATSPYFQAQPGSVPQGPQRLHLVTQGPGNPCLLRLVQAGPAVNFPLQIGSPQNLPTVTVHSSQSPLRSGQQPATPLVTSSLTNSPVPGSQVSNAASQLTRSFFILPQPPLLGNVPGNLQGPMQHAQSPVNVALCPNQPSQDQSALVPQVHHSSLLTQPPTPLVSFKSDTLVQQQPSQSAASPSPVSTGSTQFVELRLHDGSKIALTVDQYRLYKAGKLGDVTCKRLIPLRENESKQVQLLPIQSANAVVQHEGTQSNKEPGPEQIKPGTKREGSDPGSHRNLQKKNGKNKKPKPLRRKLHTKSIALLPPNIAALQALTSLLQDRKNLQTQQSVFIAKFQRHLQKVQRVDSEREISFSGYLESRNMEQGELSQAGKTSTISGSSQPSNLNSSAPSCSESAESEASTSQSLEDHLAVLRKSDLYKVLQQRFLSLFLWPGLLSSTRIKGTLNRLHSTSHYTSEPLMVKQERKPSTLSKPKDERTCRVMPSTSCCSGNQERGDVSVVPRSEPKGRKRKADESCSGETPASSSCHGEEKKLNGERDGGADAPTSKKRRATGCSSSSFSRHGEEKELIRERDGDADSSDGVRKAI